MELRQSASRDKVYTDLMVEKARKRVAGGDARWSPVSQVKSLKEGALGVEEAKKIMKVGRLGMQEERERVGGTCHWCGQKDSQRGSHQQHHCPGFFQRAVQASHALLKGLVNHEGWTRVGVADVEA